MTETRRLPPSRHVIFEFAGMPKSGKTTVLDVVAHYLRRHHIPLAEYHGGGRYAPIDKDHIGRLNLYLASEALRYLLTTTQPGLPPKVHLMDRGLVDRLIFTRCLLAMGRIDEAHSSAIEQLLAVNELAGVVDACAIFHTSPELSLARELRNRLVDKQGRVINSDLLTGLATAAVAAGRAGDRIHVARSVFVVDTTLSNDRVRETAIGVLRRIAPILASCGIDLPEPRLTT